MIDKSGAKVRAMFSDIAPTYDLLNRGLSGGQDAWWRKRAASLLAPRRGELILDLCCGTGDLTLELQRRQPGARVIGADFALPMLSRARGKSGGAEERRSGGAGGAGESGPGHSERSEESPAIGNLDRRGFFAPLRMTAGVGSPAPFLAADALHLPFADGSFDAVSVAFGVRNFEDTRAGMEEIARVLKPGGRLLVLEFMRHPSGAVRRFFALFNLALAPVGRAVSGHPTAYAYLPASVDEFYSKDDFARLLRQTGFRDVRLIDHSLGVATSTLARKP